MPKLWLFDLDDTLFEASGGMLHKIHLLMNEYMCRELGMEWEEASALRRHYWSVYGATFLGLWRHHGIDPRDFLSFAHDFDPRLYIQFSGCPAEDVKRLPGRRERQKFCVHGIIGARQTGASNEHEHQTQFS